MTRGRPARRKRVMIVAPEPPYPLHVSGNSRVWNLCKALADEYTFTLAAFVNPAFLRQPAAEAVRLKLSEVFEEVRWVPLSLPARDLWAEFADPAVGSSRVDLQACKLEYSIVSPK